MNGFRYLLLFLFAAIPTLLLAQPGPMGGCFIRQIAFPDGQLIMSNDSNLLIYSLPSSYDAKNINPEYFHLTLDNRYYSKDSVPVTISLSQEENYLFLKYHEKTMCIQMDVPGLGPNGLDNSSIDTLYFRPGNWILHQYNRRGMTLTHLEGYRARTKETLTENYWLFEPDHHLRLSFPEVEKMSQSSRINSALDLLNYTNNSAQAIKLGLGIWQNAHNTVEEQFASNILWIAYARAGDYEKAYQWYLQFYKVWDNKYGQQGVVDFLVKINHPEEAIRFLSDMIDLEPHPYNYVTRGNFHETVSHNYFAAVLDYQQAFELEKHKGAQFINPLASNDVAYLHFRKGRALIKANLTMTGLDELKQTVYSAHFYTHYEETLAILDSLESTCGMSSDLYLAMALCEYRLAVLYPNTGRSPDNLFTDAELHFSMAEERGGNANLIAFFRADYYRILSQKEKALAYLKLAELDYSLKESCENLLPYITLLR